MSHNSWAELAESRYTGHCLPCVITGDPAQMVSSVFSCSVSGLLLLADS
jgi:hypothetical protein